MNQTDLNKMKGKLEDFIAGTGERPTSDDLRLFQRLVIQKSKQATAPKVPVVTIEESDGANEIEQKMSKADANPRRTIAIENTRPLQDLLAKAISKLSAQ